MGEEEQCFWLLQDLVRRSAGVKCPAPIHPDGGRWPVGEVGTWANTGAKRPTLGTHHGGGDGSIREWCPTSPRGWYHGGRWCHGRLGHSAILNRPSCGELALTIVSAWVGVLLGGHVGGEGGLHIPVQNRKTDFRSSSMSRFWLVLHPDP